MARSARFWDRIAERYARKPVADEAAYQKKLAVTREYLRPDMVLLEFGCGTGSTAIIHAPHVKDIHAIDISAKMIEIARRKAEYAKVENLTFEQSDIAGFSAPDESFDGVLGLSILHLLEDPEAAIEKVHRMLKPGGIFVTSTACLGDSMRWFGYVAPLGSALGMIPLVKVFTAQALRDSMTRAGFAIARDWQQGDGRTLFLVARKPAA